MFKFKFVQFIFLVAVVSIKSVLLGADGSGLSVFEQLEQARLEREAREQRQEGGQVEPPVLDDSQSVEELADSKFAEEDVREPIQFNQLGNLQDRYQPIWIRANDGTDNIIFTKAFVLDVLPKLKDYYTDYYKEHHEKHLWGMLLPNSEVVEAAGMVEPTLELVSKLVQVIEADDAEILLQRDIGLLEPTRELLKAKVKVAITMVESLDWLETAKLLKIAIDSGIDLNQPISIYSLMAHYLKLIQNEAIQEKINNNRVWNSLNNAIQTHLGEKLIWLKKNIDLGAGEGFFETKSTAAQEQGEGKGQSAEKSEEGVDGDLRYGDLMVRLTGDQVRLFPVILAAFNSKNSENKDRIFVLDSELFEEAVFRFLEAYLESPNRVQEIISAMSGEQIVDILQVLDFLGFDFGSPKGGKLIAELLAKLRDNLSPNIIERVWWKLEKLNLLGLQDSEVVGGLSSWSPDGQTLWVKHVVNQVWFIRVYQIVKNGTLKQLGRDISGYAAGWSPNSQMLWIKQRENRIDQLRIYQLTDTGLNQLAGEGLESFRLDAGWSSDSQILWVKQNTDRRAPYNIRFYRLTDMNLTPLDGEISGAAVGCGPDGLVWWVKRSVDEVDKIGVYRLTEMGLEQLGEDVLGSDAGWSSDGQMFWVRRKENGQERIGVYRLRGMGLEPLGEDVLGSDAGWSPDGQMLWVRRDVDASYWMGNHRQIDVHYHIGVYRLTDRGLEPVGKGVSGFGGEWSPDGQMLSVRYATGKGIRVYRLIDAGLNLLGGDDLGRHVVWSPDGQKLLVQNGSEFVVYRLIDGRLEQLGGKILGYGADWSPDGQTLSMQRVENEVSKIRTLNINFLELQFIPVNLLENLTLVQKLLLLYLVREHDRAGSSVSYELREDSSLWPVWMSLSEELRNYLIENRYVSVVIETSGGAAGGAPGVDLGADTKA